MGVKDLDMQYMLGDSILVAPIFREDSMGEFYLPEGTWTHLLSGERREGGRWYTKVYDIFLCRYLYVKIQYLPWAKMISCRIMNMQRM